MFGLSFWEIAVILVVALLALGPEKLPKLLKTIGRGMRQVRQASNELRSAIEEPLQEIREPLEEMRDSLYESVSHAEREIEAEAQRVEASAQSLFGLAEDAEPEQLDEHAHFDEPASELAGTLETHDPERYLAEHGEAADDATASLGLVDDPADAPTRLDVPEAPTTLDAADAPTTLDVASVARAEDGDSAGGSKA